MYWLNVVNGQLYTDRFTRQLERRKDPHSLIFDAIFYGNKNEVQQLISGGVDKHVVTHHPMRWEGASVLGAAANEGHMEIVRYLVDIGTSVNFSDPCQGRTPLHWACLGNQYQVAAYLIKHGADVNHVDKEQTTPILRAAFARNCDMVKLLIKNGASVLQVDLLHCSALHYACIHGDKNLTRTLIRAGCISNNFALVGKGTPLQTLTSQNDLDNVTLLLEAGYNLQNDQSWIRSVSNPNSNSLHERILSCTNSPMCLRHLCRKTIRSQMHGVQVEEKLEKLKCPSLLQKFLTLDIL
ncbi:serine/threonine-protein phosphatase 6 regulatory ankyrin repeat subunit C-like isoform X1 [Saccostrea echinata]|uniref:serine/threonine-protein phosphatase 6 regulatory ankyrin repeat subunit C-like isoform X1 n=1 Tax=Saccostrea echinata TaxID=191078 RepID=UPI002A8332F0|nr:serine/threonine-protein phosphatase 6 regulatory ankyrin repeat subunit C-like isoform X1 [Saccostrea echinata]